MDDRIRFRQWSPPTRSGWSSLRKADPVGKTPGSPPTPLKPKTIATSVRSGGSILSSPEPSPIHIPSPTVSSPRSGGVVMTPTEAGAHAAQIGAQRSFSQRGGRSGAAGATVSGAAPQGVRQPSIGATVGTPRPELPGAAPPQPTSPRSLGGGMTGGQMEAAARGARSGAAGETIRGPDLPVTRQSALRGTPVVGARPELPGGKPGEVVSPRSGGGTVSAGQFEAAARPARSGAAAVENVRGPTVISAAGTGRRSPVAEHVAAQEAARVEGTGPHPFAAAHAEQAASRAESELEGAKAELRGTEQKIKEKQQARREATLARRRVTGPNVQGWAQWGEGLGHATVAPTGGATSAGMWGQRGVAAVHGLLNRRTLPSVEAARQQREAQIQRQQALQAYRGELGGVHTTPMARSLDGTPPVRSGIRRRTNNG